MLRERRKNVHAGVQGIIFDWLLKMAEDAGMVWTRVSYNPYKAASFCTADGTPVYRSSWVKLTETGCYVSDL